MTYQEFCDKYGRCKGLYNIMLNGWQKCLQYVNDDNFSDDVKKDIEEFVVDFYHIEDKDTTNWIEREQVDNIYEMYCERFVEDFWQVVEIDLCED